MFNISCEILNINIENKIDHIKHYVKDYKDFTISPIKLNDVTQGSLS